MTLSWFPFIQWLARVTLFSLVAQGFLLGALQAQDSRWTDATYLMFVGEDLSVLSIASKREERVREAPALANVITGQDILQYGFHTIEEALSSAPGTYIAHQDRSSRAYFRGVRDATLFLFDGIPFSNDSTTQGAPLDRELSLSWVKRIEVIRGPSSVLWGPDAFSGVVNVVPLKGKDLAGFEMGTFAGNPDSAGGYAQWGKAASGWDAMINVNGSTSGNFRDRFRTRTEDPDHPIREGTVPDDYFVEVIAACSYSDWLNLSGRFSDFKHHYTLNTQQGPMEPSFRSNPFSMIKLDLKTEVGGGDLRFHSFFNYYNGALREGTDHLSQDNKSYHFELLYDRSFWQDGLLTLGTSFRHNDAVEEFLSADPFQESTSVRIDYNSNLVSFFGQLRQKWDAFDLWVGGRFDSHSEYEDNLSFRAGTTWLASESFTLKLLLGTAFRTPANILATRILDLKAEQVQGIELAAYWTVTDQLEFRSSVFHNRLKDLIQQNTEGAVTNRDTEKVVGMEIEASYRPFPFLKFFGNATLLDSSGDPVQLEGFREDRYDLGPSVMANLGTHWNINGPWNASLRLRYLGEREVARVVLGTDERPKANDVLLLDLNLYARDLFRDGLTAGIKVNNLLDSRYREPGNFNLIEGDPLTWRLYMSYRF